MSFFITIGVAKLFSVLNFDRSYYSKEQAKLIANNKGGLLALVSDVFYLKVATKSGPAKAGPAGPAPTPLPKLSN